MQVDEDEAEELAQVQTGDHLLKRLLVRTGRVAVDDDVVGRAGQDDVLAVKGAVLAVDGNGRLGRQLVVFQFGHGAEIFHVGGVAAGAEDAADLDLIVRVGRGDQRAGGVVDQRRHFDGQASPGQGVLEHGYDVMSLDAVDVEAFGPPLQDAVVDVVLRGRVRKREAEGHVVEILAMMVVFDELLQAVGDVLPQFFRLARLELFGHAVFGLGDVKFALFLRQRDFADTEVRAAHVQGQVGARLVSGGVCHDPGRAHGLYRTVSAVNGLQGGHAN